jgi:hypothetical protein
MKIALLALLIAGCSAGAEARRNPSTRTRPSDAVAAPAHGPTALLRAVYVEGVDAGGGIPWIGEDAVVAPMPPPSFDARRAPYLSEAMRARLGELDRRRIARQVAVNNLPDRVVDAETGELRQSSDDDVPTISACEFDPSICGNGNATAESIALVDLSGARATAKVIDGGEEILVRLVNEHGWKIDKVECPQ